jgi:hypothetical protein
MPRQSVTLACLPDKSPEPSIEPAVAGERARAQLFPGFYRHSTIGALSTFGLMRDTISHSLQTIIVVTSRALWGGITNLRDNAAKTGNPLAVSAL